MRISTLAPTLAAISILLAAAGAPAPTSAGELQGVTMADSKDVGGTTLVLNGMALRKVAIVKVYVAGLYLPKKTRDGDAILAGDTPRQLVMQWLRSGGKDRICSGWYDGLEANTPNASAELRADFDTLCGFMEEAGKKDLFVFTYTPGSGTEVSVRGTVKGTIEGKAFADALWAVWIGPEPGPGAAFKKGLLGG